MGGRGEYRHRDYTRYLDRIALLLFHISLATLFFSGSANLSRNIFHLLSYRRTLAVLGYWYIVTTWNKMNP